MKRSARRWLSFLGSILGGLTVAVLVARFVVGVDGLVEQTELDGLDYLAPWWLAALVLPVGLLCLWAGRRWSGAILLVLFFALLGLDDDWRWHGGGSIPLQSRSLTVLTFNVSHYEAGVAKVVRGIKSLNPDVVLLSENCLGAGSVDELRAAFAPYTLVLGRTDDMAVASRLPILNATEVDLPSKEPSRRCSKRLEGRVDHPNRSFLHVRVNLHGTIVNVISVRFIGGRAPSRALSDELAWGRYLLTTQRDELRFLLDYVSCLKGPVVFGGDLNATPTARLIRGLETSASDAYLTNHWVGLPTFPAKFPIERLDYLFSMNGVVATYAVRPDLRVSDHYPVLARFAVQQRAAALHARVVTAAPGKAARSSS
jgi:endonuclease/exonuclease/phosphatase (EEP) superfamily protein YafD